jgi:uncharacterized protein (DUF2225 family)
MTEAKEIGKLKIVRDIETSDDTRAIIRENLHIKRMELDKLLCKCGHKTSFVFAASLTVRQTYLSAKDTTVLTLEIPNIYVMPDTVTVCQHCFHTAPYKEFVERYQTIHDEEYKEKLIAEIEDNL